MLVTPRRCSCCLSKRRVSVRRSIQDGVLMRRATLLRDDDDDGDVWGV